MSYLSSMELMEKEDEHIARLTGYFALYRELCSHVGSRPLTLGCKWTKSRLLEAVKAEATMEEDNYQAQVKLGLVSQRPFPPYCTVYAVPRGRPQMQVWSSWCLPSRKQRK